MPVIPNRRHVVLKSVSVVTGDVSGCIVKLSSIKFDGEPELAVEAVKTLPATQPGLPFKRWQLVPAFDSLQVAPLEHALDPLSGDTTHLFDDVPVAETLS